MLFNAPSGSSDANASFVGKDVAAGKQGSKVPPMAIEGPQREIVAVIASAQERGLDSPTNSDMTQLLRAVRSGLLSRFLATGTPDAIVIAPKPAYAALIEGLRFRFKVPGTNVSNTIVAPTFAVNGVVPVVIKTRTGAALAAGDLVGGNVVEGEIDANGFLRIQGAVASETVSQATVNTTVTAAVSALKAPPFMQFTAGPFTAPIPAGAIGCRSKSWGGGGGGGGVGSTSNGSASGGGGGGYSFKTITGLAGGGTLSGVVGAGGAAGGQGGSGGNGGTTSVASYHSATGGFGGTGNGVGSSGQGGNGFGGDVNLQGGAGSAGGISGYATGGPGGGAPYGGNGGGGAPGIAGPGMSPGGGGGGSGSTTINLGGPGAPGAVILEWF